eukprot:TRINITY_DN113319_c0_g1_i1.p1 TRINITY_DN113319_c0_g1~~TRINITY_DN113319_c0_g1_i1.p1  ORF type:complete len:222 (+),score=38.09 TRINITY_DN113319_c0_g1_i1:53-667(+)
MSSFSVSLAEMCGAFASAHVAFSGVSILNAALASSNAPAPGGRADLEEDAAKLRLMRTFQNMYTGKGLGARECTEDITYTDPVARCVGRKEVVEVFRSLRALRPESMSPPLIVIEAEDGSCATVYLWQRYAHGSLLKPSGFELKSTVRVELAADGRIRYLEERWNDAALLQWSPFRWVRRLNGLASYTLTTWLVPPLKRAPTDG